MAEADKDGRAAQMVSDLMATTVMSMNEGMGEGRKRLAMVNQLLEAELERDHWEAEHAAIFHVVLSEDAAAAIAKCFAGYNDLEWQRLEAYDRARITAQGERVVKMLRQAIGG
jgi:hypothetical protein